MKFLAMNDYNNCKALALYYDNHVYLVRLRQGILIQFGNIVDYQDTFYTICFELNYGFGDKNIKIEIS